MKERLLTMLAAVALLVTMLQPTLPTIPYGEAAAAIVLDGSCHGGGQCGV